MKDHINIDTYLKLNVSPTFWKFAERIASIKRYPMLDVPCGYGRHSFLLGRLGCNVISVDIDRDALNYILVCQKKYHLKKKQLTTLYLDLTKDSWPFSDNSIGAIVNVHYYQSNLLDDFKKTIVPGGYLYFETPGNYGNNFIDLPPKGFIRAKIEPFFQILYYKEKPAGPNNSGRMTIKLFAQKNI